MIKSNLNRFKARIWTLTIKLILLAKYHKLQIKNLWKKKDKLSPNTILNVE